MLGTTNTPKFLIAWETDNALYGYQQSLGFDKNWASVAENPPRLLPVVLLEA